MIHLYLSMPAGDVEGHRIVDAIIALNASVGLVQASVGDDETSRRVANAHIAACEGMLAVIAGKPTESQIRETRHAAESGLPVLLFADRANLDAVGGRPVRTFSPATFHEFVDTLPSSRRESSS